ncbi:MAG TPA: hypothetical protein H9698_03445 [Candidatus Ruthenibacterium merdavium]|uniref:Uncharacterized protein n=1 Tax=Candidatus Ruthenibacterium merdavium TaxID=2838752 RepID=A0A9D2Q2W0_9FIRM|nr:hypothetical protein [Candidatus Ruthenibacterium merdavium]
MESFVDRIIETDRKARAVIEKAQKEKETLLNEARKKAQDYLEKQELNVKEGREAIDREFEKKTLEASNEADKSYLDQKHALDEAFEHNRSLWLKEITQNILTTD